MGWCSNEYGAGFPRGQFYGSRFWERRSSATGYWASLARMRSMCAVIAALSSRVRRWNSSPSARNSSSDRVRMRSARRFRGSTGRLDFLLLPVVCLPYRTLCRTSYTRRKSFATTIWKCWRNGLIGGEQRSWYFPGEHGHTFLGGASSSAKPRP